MQSVIEAVEYARQNVGMSIRIACTIAIVVCVATLVWTGIMGAIQELKALSDTITLTVFLDANLSKAQIDASKQVIERIDGVDSVTIKSAEQVQKEFLERFNSTIDGLLPDNPFSAIVTVAIKSPYRTTTSLDSIGALCKKLRAVNEVTYKESIVRTLATRSEGLMTFFAVGGITLALALLLLLWNTLATVPTTTYSHIISIVGCTVGVVGLLGCQWYLMPRVAWFEAIPISGFVYPIIIVLAVSIVMGMTQRHHNFSETP